MDRGARWHAIGDADPPACQAAFDAWRGMHNLERPYAALGPSTSASHHRPSPHTFAEALPSVADGPGDEVRADHGGGQHSYRGRACVVGRDLRGRRVARRPTTPDGVRAVLFGCHRVGEPNPRRGAGLCPARGGGPNGAAVSLHAGQPCRSAVHQRAAHDRAGCLVCRLPPSALSPVTAIVGRAG